MTGYLTRDDGSLMPVGQHLPMTIAQGTFRGVSLGAPVFVRWNINETTGAWTVIEVGNDFRETTVGNGYDSLDAYLETLKP